MSDATGERRRFISKHGTKRSRDVVRHLSNRSRWVSGCETDEKRVSERDDDRSKDDEERDEQPPFDQLDVVNAPTTKTESLERTLDRAESVLEGQLTDLSNVHERAIRTVRIAAILLGASASIAQVKSIPASADIWLSLSGILLVASIGAGVFSSSALSADYGPGPEYVRPNIKSGDSNDEVYLELLQGYDEAISYNQTVVVESERYLFVTQLLLVTSIVLGSVAIAF